MNHQTREKLPKSNQTETPRQHLPSNPIAFLFTPRRHLDSLNIYVPASHNVCLPRFSTQYEPPDYLDRVFFPYGQWPSMIWDQ